jgi:hypothetical protein
VRVSKASSGSSRRGRTAKAKPAPAVPVAPSIQDQPLAPAPSPRRMNRPRWLDIRVVGGLLLVVGAVVLGAKVVGSADRTDPVWAVTHSLATGTVLTAGDLQIVRVNLQDTGNRYLSAADDTKVVVGMALNRPVEAGDLLPVAAVAPVDDKRTIVFAVDPSSMPPNISHGSKVDIYLSVAKGAGAGPDTSLIAGDVTVQSSTAPNSGGLSAASTQNFQVSVQLPPQDADRMVKLLPTGHVMLTVRTGS